MGKRKHEKEEVQEETHEVASSNKGEKESRKKNREKGKEKEKEKEKLLGAETPQYTEEKEKKSKKTKAVDEEPLVAPEEPVKKKKKEKKAKEIEAEINVEEEKAYMSAKEKENDNDNEKWKEKEKKKKKEKKLKEVSDAVETQEEETRSLPKETKKKDKKKSTTEAEAAETPLTDAQIEESTPTKQKKKKEKEKEKKTTKDNDTVKEDPVTNDDQQGTQMQSKQKKKKEKYSNSKIVGEESNTTDKEEALLKTKEKKNKKKSNDDNKEDHHNVMQKSLSINEQPTQESKAKRANIKEKSSHDTTTSADQQSHSYFMKNDEDVVEDAGAARKELRARLRDLEDMVDASDERNFEEEEDVDEDEDYAETEATKLSLKTHEGDARLVDGKENTGNTDQRTGNAGSAVLAPAVITDEEILGEVDKLWEISSDMMKVFKADPGNRKMKQKGWLLASSFGTYQLTSKEMIETLSSTSLQTAIMIRKLLSFETQTKESSKAIDTLLSDISVSDKIPSHRRYLELGLWKKIEGLNHRLAEEVQLLEADSLHQKKAQSERTTPKQDKSLAVSSFRDIFTNEITEALEDDIDLIRKENEFNDFGMKNIREWIQFSGSLFSDIERKVVVNSFGIYKPGRRRQPENPSQAESSNKDNEIETQAELETGEETSAMEDIPKGDGDE